MLALVVVSMLLGSGDWACDYQSDQWKSLGVAAPCRALKKGSTRDEQLAAAKKEWKLKPDAAACAVDAAQAQVNHDERARPKDESGPWLACAHRFPTEELFWKGAVITWGYATDGTAEFADLPTTEVDGRVLADRLLDFEFGPRAVLVEKVYRLKPQRLVELLTSQRTQFAHLDLAWKVLQEKRTLADGEWDALGPALVEPYVASSWMLAAELWLQLPPACRQRLVKSPKFLAVGDSARARRSDITPEELEDHRLDRLHQLVLGLLANGQRDEAVALRKQLRVSTRNDLLAIDATRFFLDGASARAISPWEATMKAGEAAGDLESWAALRAYLAPFGDEYMRRFRRLGPDSTEERERLTHELPAGLKERVLAARDRALTKLPKFDVRDDEDEAGDAGAVSLPVALPSPFVEDDKPWKGAAPKSVSVPRDSVPRGFWVVRSEKVGKTWVVLAGSQRLDPVGEMGPGGYWLLTSTDGQHWQEHYLCLVVNHPFVAKESADVPLLDDKGEVRLVMKDAPLDEKSITFPPIGLRADVKRARVVLKASLKDLDRDGDGDGLSDLAEARMLLDPTRADTDGDGVRDGDDPTPRTDDRVKSGASSELVNAFFEDFLTGRKQPQALVVGVGGGPVGTPRSAQLDDVRFLLGAPGAFAGLKPLVRLVTLTPAELAEARKRFGTFFPMSVEVMTDGKDHAFISWNERWRGGSVRIDRDESGKLVVTDLGGWIT